jgi:hypothetical protein
MGCRSGVATVGTRQQRIDDGEAGTVRSSTVVDREIRR